MSKKNFAKGIDAILDSGYLEKHKNNEEFQDLQKKNSKKKAETRTSMMIDPETLEILSALAFWERKSQKEIWNEAIAGYLATKSEKHILDALQHYKERNNSSQK